VLGVRDFDVNERGVFYLSEGGTIHGLEKTRFGSSNRPGWMWLCGDTLSWSDGFGKQRLYDLANDRCVFTEKEKMGRYLFGFSNVSLWTKRAIQVSRRNKNGKKGYWLLNIDDDTLIEQAEKISHSLNDGRYLFAEGKNGSALRRINKNCELIWEFDFNSIVDLEGSYSCAGLDKLIGIHNKLLWLSDRRGLLVALDIGKGGIKHTIDVKRYGFPKFVLDESNDRLVAVEEVFLSVDLNADIPAVSIANIFKFGAYDIPSGEMHCINGLVGPRLFCFDNSKGAIAVVNLETCEMEWVNDLCQTSNPTGIRKATRYDNELYVLDGSGGLHVFEFDRSWLRNSDENRIFQMGSKRNWLSKVLGKVIN